MKKRMMLATLVVLLTVTVFATNGVYATYITPISATAAVNNADAHNTIDGNVYTFWQAASYDEALQWIKYDLGEIMHVVGFQETSGAYPGNPYTLFASDDDISYVQVASGILTQDNYGDHIIAPMDVQFLKMFVERTNNTGYGELVEFRAIIPEPGSSIILISCGVTLAGRLYSKRRRLP